MDTLHSETHVAERDSGREHSLGHCRVHFPLLHAANIRVVLAWFPQAGHSQIDYAQ
jgi:hypothetical protein